MLTKAGGVAELTEQHIVDGHPQVWRYRYATRLPLRADTHPVYVNWCEVTITTPDGALLYHNAWATDHALSPTTLHTLVVAARTRWKSENENNNVLKNYGYHLEHNFGHGDQYLALVLVMLNLLAFLFHTVLELCDEQYRRCGSNSLCAELSSMICKPSRAIATLTVGQRSSTSCSRVLNWTSPTTRRPAAAPSAVRTSAACFSRRLAAY